jgi:hypothetical protein
VEWFANLRIQCTSLWQAVLRNILKLQNHSSKFANKISSEHMSKEELTISLAQCLLVKPHSSQTMLLDKTYKRSMMLAIFTCVIFTRCILMCAFTVSLSVNPWSSCVILLPIKSYLKSLQIVKRNSLHTQTPKEHSNQIMISSSNKTLIIAALRLHLTSTW